jgi:hypothetical protein
VLFQHELVSPEIQKRYFLIISVLPQIPGLVQLQDKIVARSALTIYPYSLGVELGVISYKSRMNLLESTYQSGMLSHKLIELAVLRINRSNASHIYSSFCNLSEFGMNSLGGRKILFKVHLRLFSIDADILLVIALETSKA